LGVEKARKKYEAFLSQGLLAYIKQLDIIGVRDIQKSSRLRIKFVDALYQIDWIRWFQTMANWS
jgi:hypothetical protein